MSSADTSDDILGTEAELDEQAQWGEGFQDRALRKVVAWMGKARDRLVSLEDDRDQAKTAIQDLRARVKALEDRAP